MNNILTMHMPGILERFGIRAHGLVKCPITVMPNGSERCYLRDYTLTTRGGKVIPVPYSEAEKELSFPAQICPRPFLYQHPLAQMEAEDEDGLDWSGYVIFYQETRNNKGYLNKYITAFTPDDNSQALLFDSELSYHPPLLIGGAVKPSRVIAPRARGTLRHIAEDGRSRLKANMAIFGNIFVDRSFGIDIDVSSYSLSGDDASGISTQPQIIDEPDYYFEKLVENEFVNSQYHPIDDIRDGQDLYKWGGGCHTEVESRPVFEYRLQPNNNYTNTAVGRSKLPIDVYVDELGVESYLYCSYEINEESFQIVTNEILRDELSWGDDCSLFGIPGKVPYRDWETSEHIDRKGLSDYIIKAEYLGEESTLKLSWDRDYEYTRTEKFSGNSNDPSDVVIDIIEQSNIINLSIMLDDVPLYERSMASQVSSESRTGSKITRVTSLESTVPKIFDSDIFNRLMFRSTYRDPPYAVGVKEDYIVEVCASTVELADGIYAFCVFISSGKYADRKKDDLLDQRFIVGKVFGFGATKDGFEVPKEEWDNKMYAAYDPASKTISDIYYHPVFYQ